MDLIANIIGVAGMVLVVAAYLMLQLNKLDATGLWFNIINLIGAILLLLSLCVHFNLASFVIEIFWIAASLVGLYRYYHRLKANQ